MRVSLGTTFFPSLPAAPTPAPQRQQAAIASAAQRFDEKKLFDEKNPRAPKETRIDLRLTQQTASSTSPSQRDPSCPLHAIPLPLVPSP